MQIFAPLLTVLCPWENQQSFKDEVSIYITGGNLSYWVAIKISWMVNLKHLAHRKRSVKITYNQITLVLKTGLNINEKPAYNAYALIWFLPSREKKKKAEQNLSYI